MASQYINLYKDNPTAGGQDGTVVSIDNAFTNPVQATVDANTQNSQVIPLAVRCMDGWVCPKGCTITKTGDDKNRWSFSLTEDGAYTDSLTISEEISNTNVLFYAKVTALNELPVQELGTKIVITADIEAEG